MAKRANTFTTAQTTKLSPSNLLPFNFFNLSGLDMYTPDELAASNRCVYGRNFRLFAPADMDKRVAISKRTGHTAYSTPIGETADQQITSTTGAADQSVSTTTWIAQKITAGATGRLTKVSLNLKNPGSATGPVIVAFYSDNSGPSSLLATSSVEGSVITSSYAYCSASFIEAPLITNGTSYWVVAYIQANGTNSYNWSSSTSASTAKTSTNSGVSWSSASFEMNVKTYVSTDGAIKGVYRYYSSTASPVTLFAHKTSLYKVSDVDGSTTAVKTGLASTATNYDFSTVNDKTYFVNGVDSPYVYNNATVSLVGGSPPIACQVEVHANHLFLLQPSTNYLVFSDAGDYETFQATSFIYVPSPKTADPVIKVVSVQGVLQCFTRNTKYLIFGTDLTNFVIKETSASKGAISAEVVCKDEEATYFVSNDFHVYAFDGSRDVKLNSERISPILRNAASIDNMYINDKKIYISYTPSGGSNSQHRVIYDLVFNEWIADEDVWCNYGISLNSQTDDNQLVVGSSLVGALYYADSGQSDLGKPITFDWWSKYMSFGAPAAKHRVKRYYPFLVGESGNYSVDCQIDLDRQNAPISNPISVNSAAHLFGDSGLVFGSSASGGSGLTFGSQQLTLSRLNVGGSARLTQFRFVQSGVDEPVGVLGFVTYVQPKRPV